MAKGIVCAMYVFAAQCGVMLNMILYANIFLLFFIYICILNWGNTSLVQGNFNSEDEKKSKTIGVLAKSHIWHNAEGIVCDLFFFFFSFLCKNAHLSHLLLLLLTRLQ